MGWTYSFRSFCFLEDILIVQLHSFWKMLIMRRCMQQTEKLSTKNAFSAKFEAAGLNTDLWYLSIFYFLSQWLSSTGTNWQRRAFTSTRATISVTAATNSFMTHGYKSTCFKSWVFFENHGGFKSELWTQAWLWDPWRGKTEGGERKGQKKFNQKSWIDENDLRLRGSVSWGRLRRCAQSRWFFFDFENLQLLSFLHPLLKLSTYWFLQSTFPKKGYFDWNPLIAARVCFDWNPFQANGGADDFSLPGCMKIAELVEINSSICLWAEH